MPFAPNQFKPLNNLLTPTLEVPAMPFENSGGAALIDPLPVPFMVPLPQMAVRGMQSTAKEVK